MHHSLHGFWLSDASVILLVRSSVHGFEWVECELHRVLDSLTNRPSPTLTDQTSPTNFTTFTDLRRLHHTSQTLSRWSAGRRNSSTSQHRTAQHSPSPCPALPWFGRLRWQISWTSYWWDGCRCVRSCLLNTTFGSDSGHGSGHGSLDMALEFHRPTST